jgi:hypothetical protein
MAHWQIIQADFSLAFREFFGYFLFVGTVARAMAGISLEKIVAATMNG